MTTEQRHTVACPACGRDLTPGARYCPGCGIALDDAAPAEANRDAPEAGPDADATAALPRRDTDAGDDPRDDRHTTALPPVSAAASAPATTDGRPCPRCGATNDPRRELCGRCGADLESGVQLSQPRPRGSRTAATSSGAPPRRHRWWIPVVAVLGVAAALLVTFWAAELGPFGREEAVPEAAFDPQRYDDDPVGLALSDVATATIRPPEGERTFTAAQMVDADPATAWHADAAALPDGMRETIDLFLAEPGWVHQVVLNNGDHADADAYEASGRVLRAELTLDGGDAYEINLLDQGRQPQYVELPEPALTTTVRLEILETVAGTDRDDIAISDLEVRGWTADAADADLAEERADIRPAAGPVAVVNGP